MLGTTSERFPLAPPFWNNNQTLPLVPLAPPPPLAIPLCGSVKYSRSLRLPLKTTLKSIVGKAKVNARYHRRAVALASTNLRYIQSLLGHSSSKTTEIYTHLLKVDNSIVKSPLDIIMENNNLAKI
jgi:integrase